MTYDYGFLRAWDVTFVIPGMSRNPRLKPTLNLFVSPFQEPQSPKC